MRSQTPADTPATRGDRSYTLTPSKTMPNVEFADDAQAVFTAAIRAGHLSCDPNAANYAGEWMYMHHQDGNAAFKHRITRKYRYFRSSGGPNCQSIRPGSTPGV